MNDRFSSPSLMRQCQLNKISYSDKVSYADKIKGNPSSKETVLNSFLKDFKIIFSLQLL